MTGNLSMGAGSKTLGTVNIRGPATIGKNCDVGPDVFVAPYTLMGDACKLKNVEIENSIVMNDCQLESKRRIVNSLIGSYSTIANGSNSVPQGHKLIIGERSFAQL